MSFVGSRLGKMNGIRPEIMMWDRRGDWVDTGLDQLVTVSLLDVSRNVLGTTPRGGTQRPPSVHVV